MRHAAHEAARRFLDGFAEDLVNTNEADFENRLEEWTTRGFPELAFYRGDRPRGRGEIVAEIRKAQRALDGDERALAQATRDELPVLAGALRVAAQTLMDEPAGQASDTGLVVIPQRDLVGFEGASNRTADDGGPQLAQAARRGTDADRLAYGEIGEFAIRSLRDFSVPEGLADAKASIAAACSRGNKCTPVDGSNASEPGDQAAWRNIVNATGGTDHSGGGNFMCVDTEECKIVDKCHRCIDGVKTRVLRDRPLTPSGTVTVNGHTLYFYKDLLLGWCNRKDFISGCS